MCTYTHTYKQGHNTSSTKRRAWDLSYVGLREDARDRSEEDTNKIYLKDREEAEERQKQNREKKSQSSV